MNEADTKKLGGALANSLKPGLVVNLIGDLGAGKTRLVQEVAEALGIDRLSVTSPTFVLHQPYIARGGIGIQHFDAYRLRDSDEFLEIGGHELIDSDAVSFVEWGDRVLELLPHDLLRIEIQFSGGSARRFAISSSGPRSHEVLAALQSRLK